MIYSGINSLQKIYASIDFQAVFIYKNTENRKKTYNKKILTCIIMQE